MINAGIYHDKLLSEPAFASLIQEDIDANPDQHAGAGRGTFSFDVCNGACGLMTGIQLVDGMLASGTADLGMVVASDMDPEPGVSRGFGFPEVGGAVLLSADPSRAGFVAFRSATFPEYAELFQSAVEWDEDARRGLAGHGRNVLTVEIAESYAEQALECAEATARELTAAEGLDLGEVDVLVATASVPGFADGLARRLGVSAERVASPPGRPRLRAHGRAGSGARIGAPRRRAHDAVRLGGRGDHSVRRAVPGLTCASRALRARRWSGCRRWSRRSPAPRRAWRRPVCTSSVRWRGSCPGSRPASAAGGPPRIITTLGRHPSLFRAWLRYSAHLMPFGALPRRDTELVILRVAWQCRSAYEWQQHVPIALRVGLTPEEIAGVAEAPASGFTERQRTLLAVSDEVLARRSLSDATWGATHARLDDREAIEVCLLIGHYQGLASTIGGLGIQVEPNTGR